MKLFYKSIALLFATTTILFTACNKDKSSKDQQFPKTLDYQGLTFTGTERVFTRAGEITDPEVKAKAIVSTGLDLISHDNQGAAPIVFSSKNILKIGSDRYSLVDNSDDVLLFASFESSVILANDTLVKFAPLLQYPGLESSGNDFIYHHPIIFHGDYATVKKSGMDFCYLQRDANNNKVVKRYVQWNSNEFNIKGLSSLGERDTLAIREYTLNFAAK